MERILYVALGGALGAILRYLVCLPLQGYSHSHFPLGTLSVNVLGSLLFGLLAAITAKTFPLSPELRLLLFTGFLGSFTTFSTFAFETFALLDQGRYLTGSLSFAANNALSILCAFGAYRIAKG
ncbi:MAG TPA: fluoride efflux transporter CrcB [Planctomycetes bacterium]|nr:fluoride efflux transporter CrcB [Planctomycetota bacterium]